MFKFFRPKSAPLTPLLARVFPNFALSSAGVTLLSAQIDDLENHCVILRERVENKPTSKSRKTSHHA